MRIPHSPRFTLWAALVSACLASADLRPTAAVAEDQPAPQAESDLSGTALLRVARPFGVVGEMEPTLTATTPAVGGTPLPVLDALWQREIHAHVALLTHDSTLTLPLGRPGSEIRKTEWFKGFKSTADAIHSLARARHVTPLPDTNLIEFRLSIHASPGERKKITEEIADAYLDSARKQMSDELTDRSRALANLKTRYELYHRQVTETMRERAIVLNIDGGSVGPRRGIKEQQLSESVTAATRASGELILLNFEFTAVQEELKAGQDSREVEEQAARDPRVRELQQRLDDLEVRREVQAVKARRKDAKPEDQESLEELTAGAKATARRLEEAGAQVRSRARAQLLHSLRDRQARADQELKLILANLEKIKDDMGPLVNKLTDYQILAEQEHHIREVVQRLSDQLTILRAQIQSPSGLGGVEWSRKPEALPGDGPAPSP